MKTIFLFLLLLSGDLFAQNNGVLLRAGSGTSVKVLPTASANLVLTANGTGIAPSWQSVPTNISIGSPISGGTPGGILYIDASNNLAQDQNNLDWDYATFTLNVPNLNVVTGSFNINSIQYIFPTVQGAANTVLTNDGAGNLSWAAGGGNSLLYYREDAIPPSISPSVANGTGSIAIGDGSSSVGLHSTVSGGLNNLDSAEYSVIAGGLSNVIYFASGGTERATISGGFLNTITSCLYGVISGGVDNHINGSNTSSILGGESNTINGGASTTIIGGTLLTLSGMNDFGFLGSGSSPFHSMSVTGNNEAILGNVDLWLADNDGSPRSMFFFAPYNSAGAFPNGTKFVAFRAPNTVTTSVTYKLPPHDGAAGDTLHTDGAGNLYWAPYWDEEYLRKILP